MEPPIRTLQELEEDNLSIVYRTAGPNVSFILRFHCVYIYIARPVLHAHYALYITTVFIITKHTHT